MTKLKRSQSLFGNIRKMRNYDFTSDENSTLRQIMTFSMSGFLCMDTWTGIFLIGKGQREVKYLRTIVKNLDLNLRMIGHVITKIYVPKIYVH